MGEDLETIAVGGGEDGRRTRGAKSRAAILRHAAALASVEGLEGLTLGRLATEAGVAKSNIQVLFGDKQALQLAVIEWVRGVYDEAIIAPALALADPLARLRAMVEGWFAFVETRQLPGGCFMNAVSSEFRARPGVVRDRLARNRAEKRARYTRLIAEAQAAGAVRGDVDPAQVAFELLAIQAHANIAVTIGDDEDFTRARASSLKLLADILATPCAAAPRKRRPPPSTLPD